MTDKVQLTAELYEANIPKCCLYQTFEEHTNDLMMCWSLASSIRKGIPMNCGFCELNTNVTSAERKEHYEKMKVWKILENAETR